MFIWRVRDDHGDQYTDRLHNKKIIEEEEEEEEAAKPAGGITREECFKWVCFYFMGH